jgi:adenylosuccinate lyase
MLDRYTTPEMREVWSEDNKPKLWALVEFNMARALGAPQPVLDLMMDAERWPTRDHIEAHEQHTRHDVVAFVEAWRSNLPDHAAEWVHRHVTSSDLVDTAYALRVKESRNLIFDAAERFTGALALHALEHWNAIRPGRTHGQWAELTTWGWRVANFADLAYRAERRFGAGHIWVEGKMSGPVGDYKRITWDQERALCQSLGLAAPNTATQVANRDGYADFVHACAQLATVIESLATEIRLGQRSEVGELAEGFFVGQRGSSAMPHKRNPITSEQLCGLARLVRAQIVPVMESQALHHERDISHSSVERVALPTAATLTHYMVTKAVNLVESLHVSTKRMAENARQAANVSLSAEIKDALVLSGVYPAVAWQLVHDAAQNPSGNLVEETKLLVRQQLDGGPEGVPWDKLHRASFELRPKRDPDADEYIRGRMVDLAK